MQRTRTALSVSALIFFSLVASAAITNAYGGQTTRVSVNTAGDTANASAISGVLSGDGRYVVFTSPASNLVMGASGMQVYRHDRATHVTSLVSVAVSAVAGNAMSLGPTVSANGRYVAFSSFASDLVTGDTNGVQDVFIRDMAAGTTQIVSGTAGAPGNAASSLSGLSGAREISDDGRYVVFMSNATNLVPAGNNASTQIYVKDMTNGTFERASVNNAGESANGLSGAAAISGDGRVVAFQSSATNLSPSSDTTQVFVRDLVSRTTTLESAGAAAVGAPSTNPALSYDGRYLAFQSATSLHPRDLDNGTPDVYLRDRGADTIVLASLSDNRLSGADSTSPAISSDGRWVGFSSLDDQLIGVVSDTNGIVDVFLYDRDNQTVTLVSLNDDGQQTTGVYPVHQSAGASVSADGRLVLFGSNAANLVPGTPSASSHLYVRNLMSNLAPVIPVFGKDFPLFEGQSMRLTWEFTDNDASTSWSATVDWGDGAGKEGLALDGKRFFLQHVWAPGSYDLTVEVTDDGGLTGSLVIHVVVANTVPSVGISPSPDLAFTRTFDTSGTFTDPGSESSETYSATVDYGDGSGAQPLALDAGSFALHYTYAAAGTYTVTVRVTDSSGGTGSATTVVHAGAYSYEWLDPLGTSFTVGRNLPVKFRVLGPDGASVFDQSVQVDVVNLSGAVVAGTYVFGGQPSRAVTWSGDSYHVNVDTKDLEVGMYWLRVRFSSATLAGEFTLATNGTASAVRSRLRD
jgi:Tol biopolymer transport system component